MCLLRELVVQVYVHRIRKYLGSYLVLLKGKVDAIIFSAGVGENCAPLRYDALADMEVGSRPGLQACAVYLLLKCLVSDMQQCCRDLGYLWMKQGIWSWLVERRGRYRLKVARPRCWLCQLTRSSPLLNKPCKL